MADNITEADQIIIQLLAALNSTIGSYAASQESDEADATANQLSLTALVVSLIALVVALLQAVLEYVSSNSAQGEKCNTGAIGEYARATGTRRWSWRHWRRQYFYPELNLNLMNIQLKIHEVNFSEVGNLFKGFKDLHPARLDNIASMGYYSWRYDRDLEDSGILPKTTIQNGRHRLSRRVEAGWAPVLPQNLPIKYRFKWLQYLVSRRHREKITPRATWAQFLTLLNVDSTKMDTSRLIGADCIPSTLDVPAQKVKLTDLGIFAFLLGFKKVVISTKDRTILATGEMGTISTETLPGFGAVVRFQILSPRPQHFVAAHEPYLAMEDGRDQLLGSFIFPCHSSQSRAIRYDWIRSDLNSVEKDLDTGCPTVADEAEEWPDTAWFDNSADLLKSETDLSPKFLKDWQMRQNDGRAAYTRRWPTILLAASIACLPGTTTGFPSSVFLHPFLQVFQHMASSLSSSLLEIWDDFKDIGDRTMVLELLQADFCRVTGHEDLTDKDKCGHLSWRFNTCDHIDLQWVEKILLSQMPHYNASYLRHENPELLLRSQFREVPFAYIQPSKRSRIKAPDTPDSGDRSPGLLEGRLLPYTVDLLERYDPVSWATAMRSQSRPKLELHQMRLAADEQGSWRNHVQPENVLWTQIYLLDMAIRKIIHQHERLNASNAVGKALVECWEDPIANAPLQSLDKFLSQKIFLDKETAEQLEQMRALADMIKVRMLCYIAYMMVIPDSTSLYTASLEDAVLMPMI